MKRMLGPLLVGCLLLVGCSLLVAVLPFGSVLAAAPKLKNAKVSLVYQHELPNIPGKSIKGVLVEYGAGGLAALQASELRQEARPALRKWDRIAYASLVSQASKGLFVISVIDHIFFTLPPIRATRAANIPRLSLDPRIPVHLVAPSHP